MSLNPRNTPCIARERRTAGAPNDLIVRYFNAGGSIGDPCSWIQHPCQTCTNLSKTCKLIAHSYRFHSHDGQEWLCKKYEDYGLNKSKNAPKSKCSRCRSDLSALLFRLPLACIRGGSIHRLAATHFELFWRENKQGIIIMS